MVVWFPSLAKASTREASGVDFTFRNVVAKGHHYQLNTVVVLGGSVFEVVNCSLPNYRNYEVIDIIPFFHTIYCY